MRFNMNEIFGIRHPTNEDKTPVWIMVDDPISLSIRDVSIDFLHVPEADNERDAVEELVARLDGMLVMGGEIDNSGEDYWAVCDAYSGDLEAIARLAEAEGVLQDEIGFHRTVLFTRQLDLARDILDAENFTEFFDLIAPAVFLLYNVHVDLLCYLVAEFEGYYDEAATTALLDPRSVDGFSPLIYSEADFKLDATGDMLYRVLGI